MTDDELQGIVARAIEDAEDYIDKTISPERARLTRYYKGEPFAGDHGITETEGQSRFVSRDVHDVVQMILPSVMDTFFGSEKVVEYVPRRPDQYAHALQATDYVNYLIREDNDGFGVFYAALKDALVRKAGFIKYWWDESVEFDTRDFSGLTPDQFIALAQPEVEILDATQDEATGLISCTARKTLKSGRLKIAALPPEEFLINRKAACIAEADDVWHRTKKTVSALVALGYDEAEMEELVTDSDEIGDGDEQQSRNERSIDGDSRDDAAMREVDYYEGYIRVDQDGDGIAELRHICCAGSTKKILRNTYANAPQFIALRPDPEPHTFFGGCPGEDVADLQRVKSQVIRLANDSMAQEVHPRLFAVDGQVNIEDLLSGDVGQPIRVRAPGMVGPIPTGNSAPMALQFAAYYDEVRENRTGQTKASAGMDADALQSTTRAAVEMTKQAAQQRVKLMVRIFAEGGFKPLFKGILRLITQHQDQPRIIRLRGNLVEVNPALWDPSMDVSVNVGLGFGNVEQKQAYLMGVLQTQEKLLTAKMPLTQPAKIYNALEDLARINEQEASRYFDPFQGQWPPEPPTPQENPLVQAEKIKAQAKLQADLAKIKADSDGDRDKVIADAVVQLAGKGMPPEMVQQYAAVVTQIVTQPRVDMGTQMGGM